MTGQSFKFILVFTREIAAHNFGQEVFKLVAYYYLLLLEKTSCLYT